MKANIVRMDRRLLARLEADAAKLARRLEGAGALDRRVLKTKRKKQEDRT